MHRKEIPRNSSRCGFRPQSPGCTRLKLKLRRNWTESTNQRLGYNIFLLSDTNKREEFSIILSNKFQALQELMEEENIDLRWQRVKGAVTSTCKCWVRGTPTTRGGFTQTLNKIEERKAKKGAVNNSRTRTAKAKAQEKYKGVNRSVKRSFKADNRNYLESLAAEAEEAAYHENMRHLYATITNLSGKYSKPARLVKDKDGQSISDREGQKSRWLYNFEELLNIQWTLWRQLDDLDYADDLVLPSHTRHQMQEKTSAVADVSALLGLKIHTGKSKVLKVNTVTDTPIMLEGEALDEVESFTYLGSIVDNTGGTEADVRARIGKTRAAF